MKEATNPERSDSIKVSRGASGKYSWEIKLYYDEGTTKPKVITDKIKTIDKQLVGDFGYDA